MNTNSFTDLSHAEPTEKAIRFLASLADRKNDRYFFDDGFARRDELAQDAKATLEILRQLLQPKLLLPPLPVTYEPQRGTPGHCVQAQVFDANGDAVCSVESTENSLIAGNQVCR